MLGKLSWEAIPFHEPIPLITSLVILAAVAALAVWVWRKGWLPALWHEPQRPRSQPGLPGRYTGPKRVREVSSSEFRIPRADWNRRRQHFAGRVDDDAVDFAGEYRVGREGGR